MAKVRIKRAFARNTFGDSRAIKIIFLGKDRKGRPLGEKHVTAHVGAMGDSAYVLEVGGTETVGVSARIVEELLPQNATFEWEVI